MQAGNAQVKEVILIHLYIDTSFLILTEWHLDYIAALIFPTSFILQWLDSVVAFLLAFFDLIFW